MTAPPWATEVSAPTGNPAHATNDDEPDDRERIDALLADANATQPAQPDQFFAKFGLRARTLRNAVINLGPLAVGPGRTIWWYDHGVYLPNGDVEVRRRVADLLGERGRKVHADQMVSEISTGHPFITDAQPTRWINCRNGLLDWRTLELHPHTPTLPTTYQLAVDWDPHAVCPVVDGWLRMVAPADAVHLMWEVIGLAVYPDQPFHKVVLLLGPGRNGKGTFLRLVTALIGPEHVAGVSLQDLGESRWATADLFGKVANIAGDLDARANIRTDIFKRATGQDTITGEHKYGQRFDFTSRATMLFAANEPPGSADHTHGYLSRFVVVPFTRLTIAPGDEDPALEPEMHRELQGVLVKAVDGLRRAMERGGFDEPDSVTRANERYRQSTDPLRRFAADCLKITGDVADTATRSAVYARYKDWCDANGHRKPLPTNRFWGQLAELDTRINVERVLHGQRFIDGAYLRATWR